ncbi:hypothetical protein JCM19376_40620 [Fusibacter bizertensis]
MDRLVVKFLWSPNSRFLIKGYGHKHGIQLTEEQLKRFGSFRDFFARGKESASVDITPGHLISP